MLAILSLINGNNISEFSFTSPFGLLALIADPKVMEATEAINNKEKIKLSWSMFNLENNNKNTQHSLPMTRSSTNFPKVTLTRIWINVRNKLIIAVLNT